MNCVKGIKLCYLKYLGAFPLSCRLLQLMDEGMSGRLRMGSGWKPGRVLPTVMGSRNSVRTVCTLTSSLHSVLMKMLSFQGKGGDFNCSTMSFRLLYGVTGLVVWFPWYRTSTLNAKQQSTTEPHVHMRAFIICVLAQSVKALCCQSDEHSLSLGIRMTGEKPLLQAVCWTPFTQGTGEPLDTQIHICSKHLKCGGGGKKRWKGETEGRKWTEHSS